MLTLTVKELGENAMKTRQVATSTDPLVNYLKSRTHENYTNLQRSTCQQIFSTAFRVLHDRAAAEDVTQEVFIKILVNKTLKAKEITSGVGYLCSLATSIARTSLRGELRRTQRQQSSQGTFAFYNGEEVSQDDLLDIRDAVVDLPEPVRVCVELRYFSGLTIREIGKTLNLTAGAIHGRLEKGLGILKARLSVPALAFVSSLISGSAEATIATLSVSSSLTSTLEDLDKASDKAKVISAGALAASLVPSSSVVMTISSMLAVLVLAGAASFMIWPEYMKFGIAKLTGWEPGYEVTRSLLSKAKEEDIREQAERAGLSVEEYNSKLLQESKNESQNPTSTLSLYIIDEEGKLVREGKVKFNVPEHKFSDYALIPEAPNDFFPKDGLGAFYRTFDLSEGNPIFIAGITEDLCPLEVTAIAYVEGREIPDRVKFSIQPESSLETSLTITDGQTTEFKVVDAVSGLPIEGALIYAKNHSAKIKERQAAFNGGSSYSHSNMGRKDGVNSFDLNPVGSERTDEDGWAVMTGLGRKVQDVEITAMGYKRAYVSNWAPKDVQTIKLYPDHNKEMGSIVVKAIDGFGEPIAELPIAVLVFGNQLYNHLVLGETDENGEFYAKNLQPGDAMIQCRLPHGKKLEDYGWEGLVDTPSGKAKIFPGQEAEGWIQTESGSSKLTIQVDRSNMPAECDSVVKVQSGNFKQVSEIGKDTLVELNNLPSGDYSIEIGMDCGDKGVRVRSEVERITLEKGQAHHAILRSSAGATVSGQLVEADSGAAFNHKNFIAFEGPVIVTAKVDENGKYTVYGLVPGKYRVSCAYAVWFDLPLLIVPEEGGFIARDFFVRESRKVDFQGIDENGERTFGMTLSHLSGPGFSKRVENGIYSQSRRDKNVIWSVNDQLPIGTHTFKVEALGRHPVQRTVNILPERQLMAEGDDGSVIAIELGELTGEEVVLESEPDFTSGIQVAHENELSYEIIESSAVEKNGEFKIESGVQRDISRNKEGQVVELRVGTFDWNRDDYKKRKSGKKITQMSSGDVKVTVDGNQASTKEKKAHDK